MNREAQHQHGPVAPEPAGPVDVAAAGRELADAVDAVIGPWVLACIARFDAALAGTPAASGAAEAARAAVMPVLRELLALDIDEQRATPLTLLRAAVAHPTAVLAAAGVPAPGRDPFDAQAFPGDAYGLSPARWDDIDASLADPGLRWSVAKAFEHRRRHRS